MKAVTTGLRRERGPRWRSEHHVATWEAQIRAYALPAIGEIPVADIDEHMVLKILEPIWLTKTATAKRVRGEIEQVLSWSAAKPRCYRPTGPNPASWRGNLEHSLPKPGKVAKVKHRPALPWQDVREFFAVLRQDNSIASMARSPKTQRT